MRRIFAVSQSHNASRYARCPVLSDIAKAPVNSRGLLPFSPVSLFLVWCAMVRIIDVPEDCIAGYHAAFDLVAKEKRFLARLEAPPIDAFEATVGENLRKGTPQVLAVDEESVVGWCQVSRNSRATESHCGTLGMGVVPTHRGQGIGKMLLSECLKRAEKSGLERIELEVFSDNRAAIHLYESFGFLREGERVKGIKIEGRYLNIVLMAKFL